MTLPGDGDGFLPVAKPEGPTSHAVVADARRALGTRRIGHTGTLDPFASGLLLLCVNRATRLAEYLHGLSKEYEAVARLGQVTATLDTEGPVVRETQDWATLDGARVREVLATFVGRGEQRPPAFSAKKVAGEAAYLKARRGEDVQLAAVPVEVHELELLELDLPHLRFLTRVSTGTYIRALARDLGEALGVGAHLTHLHRTAIGPFLVAGAPSPDQLEDEAVVESAWISPLEALAHLHRVEVGPEEAARLESGQSVPLSGDLPGERVQGEPVAVSHRNRLLAVAHLHEARLRPRKVFPRG